MSASNHVKKVAIVGAAGTIGKYIVKELLQGGKHEVTALTRADSKAKIPEGVKIAKVSYDDPTSLTQALEGQDVLVITMAITAPQDTQEKLVEAAAAASVPFVLPNEWGIETSHGTLGTDTLRGPMMAATRDKVEALGKSAWIGMTTGYWYSYSLASPEAYGLDWKKKTMTFFDDGTVKINTITWEKTGKAVAALLSLPIEPEKPGAPALSDYRNKHVYVSSWLLSQKDMFEVVLRASGTKESDWTIKYEPAVERYEEAKKRVFAGDRSAYQRLLYTRTFYNNGDGDFETRHGLDNEKLGLRSETQEDLEAATKYAFELVDSGYKYGA
ncbi:putative oxidoreductase CipA [Xylariaceae sp. FL1651]|nr:putative oxidoreductase CipA [Xylariaceae sp. FL1651]